MDARRDIVEIDLSSATTPGELHVLMARSLAFPDWYGCNWDAFWDAITGLVEMPRRLRLVGWPAFAARLPDDARLMRKCLEDLQTSYPEAATHVEYV